MCGESGRNFVEVHFIEIPGAVEAVNTAQNARELLFRISALTNKDMTLNQMILASGSPRRKELLEQIGICPVVLPSKVNEQMIGNDPAEIVQNLSRQKAEDVASHLGERFEADDEDLVVLGADTVVACEGRILGKPKSHEEAAAMIRLLSGRTHEVLTGVTLIQMNQRSGSEEGAGQKPSINSRMDWEMGKTATFYEETKVHVVPMSEEEIRVYASLEEPMDKAGAYGIQGSFGKFISGIEGDYYNVVGLPIAKVYQRIKEISGKV